ncbi:MAG: hypothetical protein OXH52_05945, partial [Gammaproteobacteria bacterium]|nr:hypothetical protein [Gammaproteobacteria bacterium]
MSRSVRASCYGMTLVNDSCIRQRVRSLSAGAYSSSARRRAAETTNDRGRFDDESRCYSVIITVARDSARMTVI